MSMEIKNYLVAAQYFFLTSPIQGLLWRYKRLKKSKNFFYRRIKMDQKQMLKQMIDFNKVAFGITDTAALVEE